MRYAIAGGGMLGAALARNLARTGNSVTLFEQSDSLGGLAAAWNIGSIVWDKHYHVILPGDLRVLNLLDELGLLPKVRWKKARSAFFAGGRLQPFTTPLDFLRFDALGPPGKLGLLKTIVAARKETDPRGLELVSAEAWLRRIGGNTVFERVWRPLLRAKLGDACAEVSAAFIWATIQRLYGSGNRKGEFGYVEGGYSAILGALEQDLKARGVTLKLGTPVNRVEAAQGGGVTVVSGAGEQRFDRAVLTYPSPAVRYQGIICSSLLLKKPLGTAYVTNIADDAVPFTGVIEMSALVDRAAFEGNSLVYLPRYLEAASHEFEMSDQTIFEQCVSGLQKMYAGFDRRDVVAFRVSRARRVFVLPIVGYEPPALETDVPGVYCVNSAQIRVSTLNVDETLGVADAGVTHLLKAEALRAAG